MRFIGITGGVGAGKSELLAYLRSKPGVRVMLADEIAHLLMEPGQTCYHEIVEHFSEEKILNEDLTFNRNALADRIFSDKAKREELNAIVHPAVKKYVLEQYNKEKKEGRTEFLFLEAALLIEEHYDAICDGDTKVSYDNDKLFLLKNLYFLFSEKEIYKYRLDKSV